MFNYHIYERKTDRVPFTYLIGWSKLNTWYYGVRYAKNCSPTDLFTTYFTSSIHVANFIEQHGVPDVIQVRKTFDTVEFAIYYEHKVLRRMRAVLSPNWLNRRDGKAVHPAILDKGKQTMRDNGTYKIIGEKSSKTQKERFEAGIYDDTIAKREEKTKQRRDAGELIESDAQRIKKSKETSKKKRDNGYTRPQDFTKEHGQTMAAKNNATIVCPHCNKSGQSRAMKQHHFDMCINNPNRPKTGVLVCEYCNFTIEDVHSGCFSRWHGNNCKNNPKNLNSILPILNEN